MINNWNDVSILQYQQLVEIINFETQHTLDKEVLLVELFSGLSKEEINKMPYSDFQELLDNLSFLNEKLNKEEIQKELKIKDKDFKINLKVENMTTEEYIDLMELTKGDVIENIHRILAVVLKNDSFETFDDKAEWIQDNLSIVTGNSIMIFFYTYLNNSIINSLETQNMMLKVMRKMTFNKKKRQQMKAFSQYLETYTSLIGCQNLESNLGMK